MNFLKLKNMSEKSPQESKPENVLSEEELDSVKNFEDLYALLRAKKYTTTKFYEPRGVPMTGKLSTEEKSTEDCIEKIEEFINDKKRDPSVSIHFRGWQLNEPLESTIERLFRENAE